MSQAVRESTTSSVLVGVEDEAGSGEPGTITVTGAVCSGVDGRLVSKLRDWYLLIEAEGLFARAELRATGKSFQQLAATTSRVSFPQAHSRCRLRFELWAHSRWRRRGERIVALGLLEPTAQPSYYSLATEWASYTLPLCLFEPYRSSDADTRPLLQLRLRFAGTADHVAKRLVHGSHGSLTYDCRFVMPSPASREYVAMLLEATAGQRALLDEKRRQRSKLGAGHRAIERLLQSPRQLANRSADDRRLLRRLGLTTGSGRSRRAVALPARHRDDDDDNDNDSEDDNKVKYMLQHDDNDDDSGGSDEEGQPGVCYVCQDERVDFAWRAIGLHCGHVLHLECAKAQVRSISMQRGQLLSFAQAKCGLCRAWLQHASLDAALNDCRALYAVVSALAQRAWLAEASAHDSMPGVEQLLASMQFYRCWQCAQPFYGGRLECGAPGQAEPAESVVCEACMQKRRETCALHGTEFVAFKCRWCCQPANYYCFGTTHFCYACHQLYPAMKPLPCPGPPACDADHPPNDGLTEHCLGCVACRAERARPLPAPPAPPLVQLPILPLVDER